MRDIINRMIDSENLKDAVKSLLATCWYSSWLCAFRRVLFQWIELFLLAIVGVIILQSLLSSSLITLLCPLVSIFCSFFKCDFDMLKTIFVLLISMCILLQVYYKHKRYKFLFDITDMQHDHSYPIEDRLNICELEIIRCEQRKEALLLERDLIKSCSPIPVVTAILGYVIEKVGLKELNWPAFVALCICLILIYIFVCIRNIQKFKGIQWKIYKLRDAKLSMEQQKISSKQ